MRFSCSASFPLLNNEDSCVSCSPPPWLCTWYLTLSQVIPVQQSINYCFLIRENALVQFLIVEIPSIGAALPWVQQERIPTGGFGRFFLCFDADSRARESAALTREV